MLREIAPGQAALSGPLDMASCAELARPLAQLAAKGPLRLDLAAVDAADSAALALLLEAKRAADRAGHHLSLYGMPAGLRSLQALYSMTDLLPAGDENA